MMSSYKENELDWLAFQYIAGELAADDCDRFEEQLAGDQAAREAVARAVELSGAIQRAHSPAAPVDIIRESRSIRESQRGSRRLAIQMSAGVAACLAIVLGLYQALRPAAPTSDSSSMAGLEDTSADKQDLAIAWSETSPVVTGEELEERELFVDMLAVDALTGGEEPANTLLLDETLPLGEDDWLTLAVASSKNEEDEMDSMKDDNPKES